MSEKSLEERDRDSQEWTLRNNGYEDAADLIADLRQQLATVEADNVRLGNLVQAGRVRIEELEAAYLHYRPLAERLPQAEAERDRAKERLLAQDSAVFDKSCRIGELTVRLDSAVNLLRELRASRFFNLHSDTYTRIDTAIDAAIATGTNAAAAGGEGS